MILCMFVSMFVCMFVCMFCFLRDFTFFSPYFLISGFGYQANALSSLDLRHQSSIRSLNHSVPSRLHNMSTTSISHLSSLPPPNSEYHESTLSITETVATSATNCETISEDPSTKQTNLSSSQSESGIPPLGVMMPPLGADISTIHE